MIHDPGSSICGQLPTATDDNGYNASAAQAMPEQQNYFYDSTAITQNTGGGSGCLISPAPGLGMSSYQLDPTTVDRGPQ